MGNSVKNSIYWNTLLRIPIKIIGFVLSIYVARLLNPTDFGIMAIVMMLIGYSNILTNFGLNGAIIQKSINDNETINSIFTVDFFISVVIASIFFSGSSYLAKFFNEQRCADVIEVMSLYFITSTFYGIAHAMLRRDMRFIALSSLESMSALFSSVLTLFLALWHFGYWSLALGQIIPQVLFTIVICFMAKWVPKIKYNHSLIKPAYDFGVWDFFKSQISYFIDHIDKILIAKFVGSYPLGIYDKSKSISVMPNQVVFMNINSVMFSSFSRSKTNIEDLRQYFRKSMIVISFISYPVFAGFILIAPYFVSTLLGEKWLDMVTPFQLISAGYLFKSFGGTLASFNVGVGNYKKHTMRLLISGLCFVTLCIVFIRYGVVGISLAFMIFSCFEFFLLSSLALKKIGLSFSRFSLYLFPSIIYTIIMSIVVFSLEKYYIFDQTLTNMFIIVVVGFLVYGLCFVLDKTKICADIKENIYDDAALILKKFSFNKI